MKQTMKPNIIRGVLRRAKEKNETGGKQPDGDAYPFLRPAMVAVVTMMSHRPAVAMVAPRSMSRVVRDTQRCPPSVPAPFLRAPVLSIVSARSVSPCTETKSEGSAASLMLERPSFSFQRSGSIGVTGCEIEPLVVAVA